MIKNTLFFCLTILSFINIKAQTFEEMMEVTQDELDMTIYDKDSTANAVVLYEYGITALNRKNLKVTTELHKKIKILKKEGLEYGNVTVLLYGRGVLGETLSKIKAKTHNIDADSVAVSIIDRDQIFVENYDGVSSIVKFTLPKVKVGSVITYSYKLTSPFIFNFNDWYFQEEIPKVTSEYVSSIPKDWVFNTQLIGNLKFDNAEKVTTPKCANEFFFGSLPKTFCENIIFKMNDIPAFKAEQYISSPKNYISKLDYELESVKLPDGKQVKLGNNWEIIDEQIKENSGDILEVNRNLRKLVPKEIREIENPKERAKAIYNLVRENYTWNNNFRSKNEKYKSISKENTGSVYELNGLLYNLMSLNDLNAKPMLLSTRDNGLPTKLYPTSADFNYMIVRLKIGDEIILLDASSKYIPFGELPFRTLNQYGRVLDEDKVSFWEDIEVKSYATNQKQIALSITDDFELSGKLNSKLTGNISHDVREAALQNIDTYKEAFRVSYPNIEITSHEVETTDKASPDFSEEINLTYEPDFIDGKAYFNPFIIKFFEDNPFKLKERTYPTDFGFKEIYQYNFKLNLGDKLKVLEAPESATIALPNNAGDFIFRYVEQDNTLSVFLKLKFNKAIYGTEYYEALKIFMNKFVEIQNNTIIVLEKQ